MMPDGNLSRTPHSKRASLEDYFASMLDGAADSDDEVREVEDTW